MSILFHLCPLYLAYNMYSIEKTEDKEHFHFMRRTGALQIAKRIENDKFCPSVLKLMPFPAHFHPSRTTHSQSHEVWAQPGRHPSSGDEGDSEQGSKPRKSEKGVHAET